VDVGFVFVRAEYRSEERMQRDNRRGTTTSAVGKNGVKEEKAGRVE